MSISGMYANTLGQDNPIRYRGYYYDFETDFYYLQSRYYDPAMGRFINADGYINANGDMLGFNMFAYAAIILLCIWITAGSLLFWALL